MIPQNNRQGPVKKKISAWLSYLGAFEWTWGGRVLSVLVASLLINLAVAIPTWLQATRCVLAGFACWALFANGIFDCLEALQVEQHEEAALDGICALTALGLSIPLLSLIHPLLEDLSGLVG